MWAAQFQKLDHGRGLRCVIHLDGRPATFAEVIAGWRKDEAFRLQFNETLANAPFAAFRWETPPVTSATEVQPFEFVLLDSPGLADRPDPAAFAEHFAERTDAGVVAFPNLGNNAIMVVPRPRFTHISECSFARHPTGSGTNSGSRSVTRWPVASASSRSGSAPRGPACHGCTYGSTIGQSIIILARTGRVPDFPGRVVKEFIEDSACTKSRSR